MRFGEQLHHALLAFGEIFLLHAAVLSSSTRHQCEGKERAYVALDSPIHDFSV